MSRFRWALLLVVVVALGGAACGAHVMDDQRTGESRAPASTDDERYGDFFQVLAAADIERWVAVRASLRDGLDRACAEGACGDVVAGVQIFCSASLAAHAMHACVWVVGRDASSIDVATGERRGDVRAVACTITTTTRAESFLDTLASAGHEAFLVPLPGTSLSMRDELLRCIADDASSRSPPRSPPGPFVEMGDLLPRGSAEGDAWRGAGVALGSAFDAECGDTFCEGDYGDIRALRLVCAVRRETAMVTGCSWSFGLTTADVKADGSILTSSAARSCAVTVSASASAVVATLSGVNALHAPLPGRTTSLADALTGCLGR